MISRISFALGIVALVLAGCSLNQSANNPYAANNPTANIASPNNPPNSSVTLPKVVVTHSVLCDITKEIAQGTIDLQCLMAAGADPHAYQAKPEDKRAIAQAKLILYGGYNLEPGLIKMIQSTQTSTPKIAISEVAVPKPLKEAQDHNQDHNHGRDQASKSEGKATEKVKDVDRSEYDPHIWHNAQNGVQMVQVIRDQLKTLSPENANLYTNNAEKLTRNLQAIDTWIKAQMATIPPNQKKLITTHESLSYFAIAYGIKLEGALQGISTEEQPTASRIAKLVQEIKSTQVPTIFPEASVNPGLMQVVAKEAKVQVSATPIFGDGIGEQGSPGDSYLKMLASNTCTIVNGLGGKCIPFVAK